MHPYPDPPLTLATATLSTRARLTCAGGIRSSLNGRERQSNHTAASRGDLGHLGRVAPESALGPCVMEGIRDLTHRYDISREAGREDDEPFILVA